VVAGCGVGSDGRGRRGAPVLLSMLARVEKRRGGEGAVVWLRELCSPNASACPAAAKTP
jgi:hypothetical protein